MLTTSNTVARTVSFAVAGAMLLGATAASAQEGATSRLDEVLDRGHLVFGTGSTNVPWHFVNDDNELDGFDVDIGRILAKSLFGDENAIEFVRQAPDARIPNLLTDRVDVTCQFMTINAPRAQRVEFTMPYYREGFALLLSNNSEYESADAMEAAVESGEEVHVAVLQNASAEDTVHDVVEGVAVDQYEEQGLVFEAVDTGRAHGGVVDLANVMWLTNQYPDRYRMGGKGEIAQSYGCAVKPGDQRWLNYINTVLREAMAGRNWNEYADAYEHWFGNRPSAPATGFPEEYR